jgi:hypothetical protein
MNFSLGIPTDSLYKFLAIFGLLIAILAQIISFQRFHHIALESFELVSQSRQISTEYRNNENDVKELEDKSSKLKGRCSKNSKSIYCQQYLVLKDRYRQLQIKEIEFESKRDQLKLNFEDEKIIWYIFFILFVLGCIMSIYGFSKWFSEQKYQDFIKSKHAKKY